MIREPPAPPPRPNAVRPLLRHFQVGISSTRALPPSGGPNVVTWHTHPCAVGGPPAAAAGTGDRLWGYAPCEDLPESQLNATLDACANETAALRAGAWPPNCTSPHCPAAVAAYRRSCRYQRLPPGDPGLLLVDALARACPGDATGCAGAPYAGNGTAAVNVSLAGYATYYVMVRAISPNGLDAVSVSDGVMVDLDAPHAGPLYLSWSTPDIRDLTALAANQSLHMSWGQGWYDRAALHHFEICVATGAPCAPSLNIGLVQSYDAQVPRDGLPVQV